MLARYIFPKWKDILKRTGMDAGKALSVASASFAGQY
jgi:hypothetical protein